jgi:hypothetical protein
MVGASYACERANVRKTKSVDDMMPTICGGPHNRQSCSRRSRSFPSTATLPWRSKRSVPAAPASDNDRLRQGAGLVRHGEEAQGRGDRRRRAFMSTTLSSWAMTRAISPSRVAIRHAPRPRSSSSCAAAPIVGLAVGHHDSDRAGDHQREADAAECEEKSKGNGHASRLRRRQLRHIDRWNGCAGPTSAIRPMPTL